MFSVKPGLLTCSDSVCARHSACCLLRTIQQLASPLAKALQLQLQLLDPIFSIRRNFHLALCCKVGRWMICCVVPRVSSGAPRPARRALSMPMAGWQAVLRGYTSGIVQGGVPSLSRRPPDEGRRCALLLGRWVLLMGLWCLLPLSLSACAEVDVDGSRYSPATMSRGSVVLAK